MLLPRVLSAALLIAVLVASVWCSRGAPAIFSYLIGGFIALASVREYFRMLEAKGMPVLVLYGTSATVIFTSVVFLTSYFPGLNHGLENASIVAIITGLFILQAFEPDAHRAIANVAGVLSGVLYVGWLWSFIFRILYFPGLDGRWFVFAACLIVKGGDMAAYAVGSAFGRHKLIPRISPGKTWEGAAGNLAGSLAAALIVWRWFPCSFALAPLLGLSVLMNVLGQVGDLSESMLKRDAAVKDSSGFIPGIGGVLDMVDSLLLAVPVLYFYLVFTR